MAMDIASAADAPAIIDGITVQRMSLREIATLCSKVRGPDGKGVKTSDAFERCFDDIDLVLEVLKMAGVPEDARVSRQTLQKIYSYAWGLYDPTEREDDPK